MFCSYHKNSLSKEQLEAIVTELQKKVKVLQQRHRRHLDKLLGLENTVSQLRQSNLLNEERLQLLERVCTWVPPAPSSIPLTCSRSAKLLVCACSPGLRADERSGVRRW